MSSPPPLWRMVLSGNIARCANSVGRIKLNTPRTDSRSSIATFLGRFWDALDETAPKPPFSAPSPLFLLHGIGVLSNTVQGGGGGCLVQPTGIRRCWIFVVHGPFFVYKW